MIKKHTQNSAQASDVTYNQTKHMPNGVQEANVKNNQTQYIQNSALTWLQIFQNTFKKVCKEVTYEIIKQKTCKKVPNTVT